MKNRVLTSLLFLAIIAPVLGAASSENMLDVFLSSASLADRRAAYLDILKNPNAYSDQILLYLENWQKTSDQDAEVLDRVIYLASAIKKNEFVGPLVNIASDPEYQEHKCIYWCPAIFALAVYSISRPWISPGQSTNWNIPHIPDMDSLLRGLSLSRSSPGIMFAQSEDQEALSKAETMSEDELIHQAAPSNKNMETRWIAVSVLACTVQDDKNIAELYWLALEEIGEQHFEYRYSIYKAILRAEKARIEKRK